MRQAPAAPRPRTIGGFCAFSGAIPEIPGGRIDSFRRHSPEISANAPDFGPDFEGQTGEPPPALKNAIQKNGQQDEDPDIPPLKRPGTRCSAPWPLTTMDQCTASTPKR